MQAMLEPSARPTRRGFKCQSVTTGPRPGPPLTLTRVGSTCRRTRESVLQPGSGKALSEASQVDYLVLVVDGTQAGDLARLGETLAVLPLAWWSYLAIVVTKGEIRALPLAIERRLEDRH